MKTRTLLRTLIALAFVGITVASCKKEPLNPPVEPLPATDFQYSVLEQRQLKQFTWEPKSNTGPLTNGEEKIEQLYVTSFNEVTLETSAPVNVSSSLPSSVSVEKITSTKFRLNYNAEGTALIKLWNGPDGAGQIVKSFTVKSQESVPLEGIMFTYAGQPLPITHYTTSRPPLLADLPDDWVNEDKTKPSTSDFLLEPYKKPMIWQDGEGETEVERRNNGRPVEDPDQGALLVFEGLIPENTSFRTVESFESEFRTTGDKLKRMIDAGVVEPGEYDGLWPNIKDKPKDVSEYIGSKMWIAICNERFYMASLKFNAPGSKYFYLYHAKENYE